MTTAESPPGAPGAPGAPASGLSILSVRRRSLLFVVLCLVCLLPAVGLVAARAQAARQALPRPPAPGGGPPLEVLLDRPHLLFVDTPDLIHRRLAVAPLDRPESGRYVTETACERVYFAGGNGLCLGAAGTIAYYYGATAFDVRLQKQRAFDEVRGVPSRARVSADGRFGSLTVFVSGDSYGAPFSTRTFILDLAAGRDLGTLEDFAVSKDGAVFQSPDFNFWGTTFARDANRFYATLGTGGVGGTTYPVQGDLARREMRVLRQNVECPSLSPDGTRIAFKKRTGGAAEWRIAVLDLATLQDTTVGESRSVDDQVEWLDDSHLLYGLATYRPAGGAGSDVWVASTDGSEAPRIFLKDALSPAVVR